MVRKTRLPLKPRVLQALAQFGADLKNMRRRRLQPMTYVCECASISRSTLYKEERGDPDVSLGIYAKVLSHYGMIERLECLVNVRFDRMGLTLDEMRLPQRIHMP